MKAFFLVIGCLYVQTVFPQSFFELNFGTAEDDVATHAVELNQNIYVAGYSSFNLLKKTEITLSKLDINGVPLWTKYFGDSLEDNGLSMTITHDKALLICGFSLTKTNNLDGILLKVDTLGNELWRTYTGGPENESLEDVKLTLDKGFVACGYISDAGGKNDAYIIKIDSLGVVQWQTTSGDAGIDMADGIAVLADSGFAVSISTNSFKAGDYDLEVLKLNKFGNPVWDHFFGTTLQNGCQAIAVNYLGEIIAVGETETFAGSNFNVYAVCLHPDGTLKWEKSYGGTGGEAAFGVSADFAGNFYLTGYDNSLGVAATNDLFLSKMDASGNLIWHKTFGSPGVDIGYDVTYYNANNLLITGRKGVNVNDYYLIRVNEDGLLLSARQEPIQKNAIIYPNPCPNGILTVENEHPGHLVIYALNGTAVAEYNLAEGSSTIVTDLQPGIYLLELQEQHILTRKKLIVQ